MGKRVRIVINENSVEAPDLTYRQIKELIGLLQVPAPEVDEDDESAPLVNLGFTTQIADPIEPEDWYEEEE
jgi:hypothetical protein